MQTAKDLDELLSRIDRRGYPAYKDTRGKYQFTGYVLSIDYVQGDPFASNSRLSILIRGRDAAFPRELYETGWRRRALQDELTRRFYSETARCSGQTRGSGHSGQLLTSRCGQEVLERTACRIDAGDGSIRLRFEAGFPAFGRTIDAAGLRRILFDFLPRCVKAALFYHDSDAGRLRSIAELSDDQHFIREQLPKLGLCAFVADGSLLPRASGVSQKPMKDAVAFKAPEELAVCMELPHRGRTRGMGIPKGVTLIVGGGYHGKSTLLRALELGVYDHIGGDGREYVITDASAVKIRAEDGRSIKHTDISMFINDLPNKKDTHAFMTEDASGSTSQAANVVEAMEAGASLLLIDEDTSATNFMVRDELMQRVISRDMEPITPFIDRVRELYEIYGISTVIVAGSSGAYFHVADHIIQMDRYIPRDITELAKKEAESFYGTAGASAPEAMKAPDLLRCPRASRELLSDRIKLKTMGRDSISIDREVIDLRYVEQLCDAEQTAELGYALLYAERHLMDGKRDLQSIVHELCGILEAEGPEGLLEGRTSVPFLAVPRQQELFACFNRYRRLEL